MSLVVHVYCIFGTCTGILYIVIWYMYIVYLVHAYIVYLVHVYCVFGICILYIGADADLSCISHQACTCNYVYCVKLRKNPWIMNTMLTFNICENNTYNYASRLQIYRDLYMYIICMFYIFKDSSKLHVYLWEWCV